MTDASTESRMRRLTRWWRTSLQRRLVVSVLVAGASITMVTAWVTYLTARNALRGRLQEQVEAMADRGVADVERWLRGQRAVLEFIGRQHGFAALAAELGKPGGAPAGSQARADRLLADLRVGALNAVEVQLLSPAGGRVLASTDSSSIGAYVVDARYYREGMLRPTTQAVYPSPRNGRPRLTIAAPVGGPGARPAGVLAAHLDLELMESLAHRPTAGSLPFDAYLVNRYREFVSAERFGRQEYRRGARSTAIDMARAGGNGFGTYTTYDGRRVIGAWRWIPSVELALLVEVPTGAAYAPAQRLLGVILALTTAAILALAIGVNAIMQRVTQPVRDTALAAERVARGDFSARAAVVSEDEVGRLAASFNRMTERLEDMYRSLLGQVDVSQEALRRARESQSLLLSIVDHASLMVCVIDLGGHLLLGNKRFRAMFSVADDDTAFAFSRLATDRGAQALGSLVEAVRSTGTKAEREVTLGEATDAHVWQVACFPLVTDAGDVYATALVGTDLTERARAEEGRRAMDARVQQARKLESLGVMAGGIAHDFNNILAAIMGNASMAREVPNVPDDVREGLAEIEVAARRAADLTRQMLAYAGRSSLERVTFDINTVVADLVRLVRASHSKRVTVNVDLWPGPLWMHADQGQVSQVILNLLTNAVEAIGEDQGTVTVSTGALDRPESLLDSGEMGSWCLVTVMDTGVGMDAETRRRIFEPFYTTKASGRGLGLSAVMGIVKSNGGRLEVDSAPGKGTRMDLFLPRAMPPVTPGGIPPTTPPAVRQRGSVLLVDDEESVRRAASRMLSRTGYTVLEAASGEEGVRLLRDEGKAVRVVVLDLTMPGMSGAEALREMRHVDPAVPVVLVSGYDARGELDGMQVRGVAFLQKPFGTRQLAAAVAAMARDLAPGGA